MDELHIALIGYGIKLLKNGLQQPAGVWPEGQIAKEARDLPTGEEPLSRLNRARQIVGDRLKETAVPVESRLLSPFCSVQDREGKVSRDCCFSLKRLSLDLDKNEQELPENLWRDFCRELSLIPEGGGAFETFCSLMCKYGWYVPGTVFAPDISVYEQFKAIVALAWCIPADQVGQILLAGGDIPGIQRILYCITSKGAAKSLRGRSFYLQLLNDAIVRAILRELNLPSACVIYNAGGNFELMARASDEDRLKAVFDEVNRRLLKLHQGEISLALASTLVPADDVAEAAGFSRAMLDLGEMLQTSKHRAFASVASQEYEDLFGVKGSGGGPRCVTCHVELAEKDVKEGEAAICSQCESFENLANRVGATQKYRWLVVEEDNHPLKDVPLPSRSSSGMPTWREVLDALGSRYLIADKTSQITQSTRSEYLLNDTASFIPDAPSPACRYGFRFVANVTPRISSDEIPRLQSCLKNVKEREDLKAGRIRDTTIIAQCDSTGVSQYGVLRMDVDDLGTLFSKRMGSPDLLHVSALSASLSLFFEGWLNRLCTGAADEWKKTAGEATGDTKASDRDKTPYILYAGGDDLMILGPWDVLPHVACRIRGDFGSFVTNGAIRPQPPIGSTPLTVSAGLTAFHGKFPIYRAADLAKSALGAAKHYGVSKVERGERRHEVVKDAVNWLGITLDWSDFLHALDIAKKIARLIKVGKHEKTVPHSFIWLLRDVAAQYEEAEAIAPPDQFPYGRWMWTLAYGHEQFVKRLDDHLTQEVSGICGDSLGLGYAADSARSRTMRFLGMAVRWAEFLIREED